MLPTIFPCLLSFVVLLPSSKKGSTDDSPTQTDSLGTGWSKVDIGKEIFFIDIFFTGNTGFGTNEYDIFRSIDGGDSWNMAHHTDLGITNIAMGNTNNAVFVSAQGGKIYYTNNGGESFDSTKVDDSGIYDAYFVSENIAYALGDNIWKTIDAGHSWDLVHAFSSPSSSYKTLFFTNEMNGWANAGSGLFKTVDGGIN